MQHLISSYLIQAKECNLPTIGKISLHTSSPSIEAGEDKMLPPVDNFSFSARADQHSEGLIKYLSQKTGVDEKEARENLLDWCREAKIKLDNGESIHLEPVGFLQKNSSGILSFQKEEVLNLFEPVIAQRAIHHNDEHAVLVGDRETTSSAMAQYLNEEEIVKDSRWKIIAIVLLTIAVIVLFVHFYIHSFSFVSGNQNHISPKAPAATYSAPNQ